MSVTRTMGKFFEDHRIKAGLSLESAAEILEIETPKMLARYESGKSLIPLAEIFSMTNAYNIPPERVVQLFYDLSFDRLQSPAMER